MGAGRFVPAGLALVRLLASVPAVAFAAAGSPPQAPGGCVAVHRMPWLRRTLVGVIRSAGGGDVSGAVPAR